MSDDTRTPTQLTFAQDPRTDRLAATLRLWPCFTCAKEGHVGRAVCRNCAGAGLHPWARDALLAAGYEVPAVFVEVEHAP